MQSSQCQYFTGCLLASTLQFTCTAPDCHKTTAVAVRNAAGPLSGPESLQ